MSASNDSSGPAQPAERNVVATLYRISTLVGRGDDPASSIERIVDELAALFAADAAAIALINPATGMLEIDCARGYPATLAHAVIPHGVGLLGWAALHARAALAEDVTRESRYLAFRPETASAMVAPLEINGQLHGVIALESDTKNAFNETHLQTMVLLTGEAAAVLRHLWALEHLQRKAAQLEVLGNVAQNLASKLQVEELLESITRESHRLTHCQLATYVSYDAAQRMVQPRAAFPPGDHFPNGSSGWPIEDSLAGAAITTRKQVEHFNLHQTEYLDLVDIPHQAHVVSVLVTPLVSEKEVIGVLSVYTDRPHRFDNDERRLLRALANIAAVALENARLYERVFESEESLRQSERLTTLGLLAAEIAHETRNPLTVIRLLFGSLDLQFPPDDPRTTDVAVIREKLGQLEAFVTRVLTFGKAPASLHSRWQLDDVIRETCLLLRLKLSQARIHMHYEPPESAIVVDCNKAQIQQVLLNVILNATQAMPEGGAITIACRADQSEGNKVVLVDIGDTGSGIPEEFRERIFDSFLSGRAEGTGLGLAIAKRIMRDHHGDIVVASSGPEGTVMRLSLPPAR